MNQLNLLAPLSLLSGCSSARSDIGEDQGATCSVERRPHNEVSTSLLFAKLGTVAVALLLTVGCAAGDSDYEEEGITLPDVTQQFTANTEDSDAIASSGGSVGEFEPDYETDGTDADPSGGAPSVVEYQPVDVVTGTGGSSSSGGSTSTPEPEPEPEPETWEPEPEPEPEPTKCNTPVPDLTVLAEVNEPCLDADIHVPTCGDPVKDRCLAPNEYCRWYRNTPTTQTDMCVVSHFAP